MCSRRLAVFGPTLLLSAVAMLSVAPDTSRSMAKIALRRHAPIRLLGLAEDGTVVSANWAGFVALGKNVTSAKGSWIVPKVNCSKTPNTYSSFWVGIDGYSDKTVEQIGTLSYCDGNKAYYYGWREFYPQAPVMITTSVHPGDEISASVTYSGGTFTLKLVNETTGHYSKHTGQVSGADRTSAEWIAEAPSSNNTLLPLADFGTALFGEDHTGIRDTCSAKIGSSTGPVGSFTHNKITMDGSASDKAKPSNLSADGSSFSVTWE